MPPTESKKSDTSSLYKGSAAPTSPVRVIDSDTLSREKEKYDKMASENLFYLKEENDSINFKDNSRQRNVIPAAKKRYVVERREIEPSANWSDDDEYASADEEYDDNEEVNAVVKDTFGDRKEYTDNVTEKGNRESSRAAIPPKSSQTRPLDIFVFYQNASGAFDLTPEFITAASLSNTLSELNNGIPQKLQSSTVSDKTTVWITVIALVVFETTFISYRDEWELIYLKARKYINAQLKDQSITLQELLQSAKQLLKFSDKK